MHDDYEYTYPSFSLAEHGHFGSPLLGPALNIKTRTYNLIVYYYASVHAVLIRVFGDEASSIPLANVFHFALLAGVAAGFLLCRRALLGAAVFLLALVSDSRMVDAARHGRPEMTAGCCLTVASVGLWLWRGEARQRASVLAAITAALTAGMMTHTSVVFFALALALAFAIPMLREATPRTLAAGLAPVLAIPALYGYFVLTDDVANIQAQMAPSRVDVALGPRLASLAGGDLAGAWNLVSEFLATHAGPAWLWLGVLAALALPRLAASPSARAARFFASTYVAMFVVHFLCLKHFVLSYRVIYQPVLYLSLAFLAEALVAEVEARWKRPAWSTVLRIGAVAALAAVGAHTVSGFRERLLGRPLPFAQLEGALTYALVESGARPGDRVFVPSPFGFHLRRVFEVVAYPAPKFYKARWSESFRQGVRRVWGDDASARVSEALLCDTMGLAFVKPRFVLTWNGDYSSVWPFNDFLRRYPGLPGMEVTERRRADLPAPYGGVVRAYELRFSDAIAALDRTPQTAATSCP